jgi:hypothetical protein
MWTLLPGVAPVVEQVAVPEVLERDLQAVGIAVVEPVDDAELLGGQRLQAGAQRLHGGDEVVGEGPCGPGLGELGERGVEVADRRDRRRTPAAVG